MKYTVIVGGNPYVVLADEWDQRFETIRFYDKKGDETTLVAEFNPKRVEGVIIED